MFEGILFALGVIVGIILATVLQRVKTGYGHFILEKIPDEDDPYRVNICLVPDQKLTRMKRIILTRDSQN